MEIYGVVMILFLQIKEFHPDVYKGTEDADAITQRIIRAYEVSLSICLQIYILLHSARFYMKVVVEERFRHFGLSNVFRFACLSFADAN